MYIEKYNTKKMLIGKLGPQGRDFMSRRLLYTASITCIQLICNAR